MKKLFLFLIILVGLAARVEAAGIIFEGEPPHNSRLIENGVNNLLRQGADIKLIEDSVIGWLYGDGYLNGEIKSDNNRILISSGQRYLLKQLSVTDDSTVVYPAGGYFVRENIDRAIQTVLDKYYDRGFYYTRTNITAVRHEDNRVSLEMELMKGPIVTVGKKLLLGLKRTKPEIIEKYLLISEGDTLTGGTLRRAENSAGAIPFIYYRSPVTVRAEPGFNRADLEFNFVEKKQFGFIGGGGYVPDDPSGLVWNIDLTLRNLFGEGRRVRVYSERKEKGRNILDLAYTQPVFLFRLGQVDFKVATRDYRDRFYEFSLDGAFRTALKPGLQTGLTLGWKRVEPSTLEPAYSRFITGFLLEHRALDHDFNPSNGFKIDWTIEFAHRYP